MFENYENINKRERFEREEDFNKDIQEMIMDIVNPWNFLRNSPKKTQED